MVGQIPTPLMAALGFAGCVDYAEIPSGITIDLSVTDENGYSIGSGGHAEGDRLQQQQIYDYRLPHDDTLERIEAYNEFWGGAGADTIDGAKGYDDEYGYWYDGSDAVFYADLIRHWLH